MQRLLLSTAALALIGGAAMAQTATTTVPTTGSPFLDQPVTDSIYASQFIGKSLYVSENDVTDTTLADVSTEWDSIGSINDVMMTKAGEVEAVLVDVGGFLGIGARTVAVNMDSLRLVTDSDMPGDYFVVFRSTRADLEAAPEFQFPETLASMSVAPPAASAVGPMGTDMAATPGTTPDGTMTGTEMGAATTGAATGMAAGTMGSSWMNPNEGYERIESASLTAEDLDGANVYDRNDDDVGSISELVMSTSGQIDRAIVDVGGFLGLGAKPVALNFSELEIHKQVDGDTYRVYLNMTKEQLEALPAYES